MKTIGRWLALLAVATSGLGAQAAKVEPVVVMAPVVVQADTDALLFTISYSTRSSLPFSKVTQARFRKVFPGPLADAGIKDGDEVIRMGGVAVTELNAASMWRKIGSKRVDGTQEEFVVRTASGEQRTVIVRYGGKNPAAGKPVEIATATAAAPEARRP